VPEPKPKRVLLDEASCLKGEHSNVRIALVQPRGRLYISDKLGPHYSDTDREDAERRTFAFFNLVKTQEANLAIAPEYFTPFSTIKKVLEDPNKLSEDCLYVLPIESLLLDQFNKLIQEANKQYDCQTTLSNDKSGTSVNPCVILYRRGGHPKLFLQTKIFESDLENKNLKSGMEFYVVEGQHIALIVLLCSDANNAQYNTKWAESISGKPGAYIIHVQCNRSPDFKNYKDLWHLILNHESGHNRLIFTLNWSIGTELLTEGGKKYQIPRSRNRILRGKILKRDSYYPNRSKAGIHLQYYYSGSRNQWEIWHILPWTEHCQVLDIKRPFENIDASLVSRRDGVEQCSYFERSKEGKQFNNTGPTGLANKFWEKCEEFGIKQEVYNSITDLSLCEIEQLCYSVLLKKKDSWLWKDVDERIPTLSLVCFCENHTSCSDKSLRCYRRENHWSEDQQYFCRCLEVFHVCSFKKNELLNVHPCRIYPLNLVDKTNEPIGWLFHGQGRPARELEKIIGIILNENNITEIKREIFICPFYADGSIKPENIIAKPVDVSDPKDYGQYNVTSATREIELVVKEISNQHE